MEKLSQQGTSSSTVGRRRTTPIRQRPKVPPLRPKERILPLPTPQTCPSYRNGNCPTMEDVLRLRTLTAPHVESYNYFLEYGLSAGIQSMEPMELDVIDPSLSSSSSSSSAPPNHHHHPDNRYHDVSTLQFWMEDVQIAAPMKSSTPTSSSTTAGSSSSSRHHKLFPREARERGLMYSGTMSGTFCYRIIERRNHVIIPNPVVRLSNKTFGDMPIMVLSRSCHLYHSTPSQLIRWKEEV
jgi:DNA-directed RNA polymerase beta subunit